MANPIAQMRVLLDRLDRARQRESTPSRPPSGRKLARTFADIVDFLAPLLDPYEIAVYLHLFRHSILKTGKPLVRMSHNRLGRSVATSAYAGCVRSGSAPCGTAISRDKIKDTLRGLSRIGAIRQAEAPDNCGALYRVALPDAIAACRRAKKKRAVTKAAPPRPSDARRAADFYTVRENRLKVYRRDGYKCQYCGTALDRYSATLDHVRPIAAGGGHDLDNLVTVCRQCNAGKSARPLGDFLAERAGEEGNGLRNGKGRGRVAPHPLPSRPSPRVATSSARGKVGLKKTLSPTRERVKRP